MKIAIGCDHGALALKEALIPHLTKKGYEVKDFGTYTLDSCDYPDFAAPAAKAVASGECDKGFRRGSPLRSHEINNGAWSFTADNSKTESRI